MTGCILHESAQAYGCAHCDPWRLRIEGDVARRDGVMDLTQPCPCCQAYAHHCTGPYNECTNRAGCAERSRLRYDVGAAVAFGLMGMAEAIRRNYMRGPHET